MGTRNPVSGNCGLNRVSRPKSAKISITPLILRASLIIAVLFGTLSFGMIGLGAALPGDVLDYTGLPSPDSTTSPSSLFDLRTHTTLNVNALFGASLWKWSLDGRRAFARFGDERDPRYAIYEAQTNTYTPVDAGIMIGAQVDDAEWSPDGAWLGYLHQVDFSTSLDLLSVDAPSYNADAVFSFGVWEQATLPEWSSDGDAFYWTARARQTYEIVRYRFDLGITTPLTDHPQPDVLPVSSPAASDDAQIAFFSLRSGQWALYIMDANGTILTAAALGDRAQTLDSPPVWAPDGNGIALTTYLDSTTSLFYIDVTALTPTVDPADNSIAPLTMFYNEGGYPIDPLWSADGRAIFHNQPLPNGATAFYRIDIPDGAPSLVHVFDQYAFDFRWWGREGD